MAKLVLVRGLPGSGKSTYAKTLGFVHLEADMYFMTDEGYQFNGSRIKDAHVWCESMTRLCLASNVNVVVSNTFTTLKEIEPYLGMTWDKLVVVRMTADYGSVHDVPQEVIEKMKKRFQPYEGELYV